MNNLSRSVALGVLVLSLVLENRSFAQVSTFPYFYGFDSGGAQNPINADGGNWTSSAAGGAKNWQQLTTGGTTGGAAFLPADNGNNKTSRLRVQLNTSGKTLNGTESFQFYIRRDGSGSQAAIDSASIGVAYSTDGSTWNPIGPTARLSTYLADTNYTFKSVTLDTAIGNKTSVYLAISVTLNKAGANQNIDNLYVDDAFIGGGTLPVQIVLAAASVIRDNDVEVTWRTLSETNNYGFEIYRKRAEGGDWTKVAFVEGHGTTLEAQSYGYVDRGLAFGKYYYQIKQIDLGGKAEYFPEMEVSVGVGPDKFVLAQNYPNPFNPSTLIDFVVPQSGFATMKVYNVLGQEVASLFEGNVEGGKIYTARFDASNLPSGLYFYTLRSNGKSDTKRMVLMK
jgi:hypothetical protein